MAEKGESTDSLLLQLGLEADDQSFRLAGSLFGSVGSRALMFGTVLKTVAAETYAQAKQFAETTDKMSQFAAAHGTSAQFVSNLGYALQMSGGSAEDAYKSIERVHGLLNRRDWGAISEGAFNPRQVLAGATSMPEAYLRLASAISQLSSKAAEDLARTQNFSDAEIALFRGGPESMQAKFSTAERLAPVTEEMERNAAAFKAASADLELAVKGVRDHVASELSPGLTDLMKLATSVIADHGRTVADASIGTSKAWLKYGWGAPVVATHELMAKHVYRPLLDTLLPGEAPNADLEAARKANPGVTVTVDPNTGRFVYSGKIDRSNAVLSENQYVPAAGAHLPLGSLMPDNTWYAPLALPASQGSNNSTAYNIAVDARGATDPAATEEAVRRGVESVIGRMVEYTTNDFSGAAK